MSVEEFWMLNYLLAMYLTHDSEKAEEKANKAVEYFEDFERG